MSDSCDYNDRTLPPGNRWFVCQSRRVKHFNVSVKGCSSAVLTLSQETEFRLFQSVRVCRRQCQI